MDLFINGKPADIVIEKEKNVGDVLSGMEQWLAGSGSRLSGLCIDGRTIGSLELPLAMEHALENIRTLDIKVSTWDEIAMEALNDLKNYSVLFSDSKFDERPGIITNWEESAAKTFLSAEIKDLHDAACNSFSGTGLTAAELGILAEERIRELEEPDLEIRNMEKPISEVAARMGELPLDVQTGKDGKAAETIQIFTRMAEKLFRILGILNRRIKTESITVNGISMKDFLVNFGTVLEELTTAYKNEDTVLIGDLAEYELAPKLVELYSAIRALTGKEA